MSLYNVDHKPEFPKMKYASTGGAVMVHSATEERALGLGWGDNDPTPKPVEDAAPEASDEDAAPVKKGKK